MWDNWDPTDNKVPGVRAALCLNKRIAELSRQHNDANVLCLANDFIPLEEVEGIVEIWLKTEFLGETQPRHQRRVQKITDYEERDK